MKKISKIFGVITLMVVIGLSMTACPEEEEEEPATIIVTNNSTMSGDIKEEGVTVALYQGDTKVKEVTGVQSTKATPAEGTWAVTKTSATFTGIEPGDYQIWVTDAQPTPAIYKSKTFTFGDGETKTLSYTGNKVE
jgi:hypothetical protein